MSQTIAIMQPYFIPYAGYFRLLSTTDLFVIYDCVQFPRRGWVHRNRLPDMNGNEEWLTLPIKKCPQETKIIDLEFADGGQELWQEQLQKFPSINKSQNKLAKKVQKLDGTPLEYIVSLMEAACGELGIKFNVKYSSSLKLPEDLRGQDRIISIAKHFAATDYVNASGGTELYNESDFKKEGINLRFLPPYKGQNWSILQRFMSEKPENIKKEIDANC